MTLQKNYIFKGLNLRKSDILIDTDFASFAANCDLNYSGELRKRNGLSLESMMPLGKDILYLTVYQQKNELLAMSYDGLYKKVGAGFVKIPMSITGPLIAWTGDLTSIEINGTLYFSDTTGLNYVFKYDGITFTQAGVRKPEISGKTGLIAAPAEEDDFFGYRTAYIPPALGYTEGLLLVLDKRPTGTIRVFSIDEYGYKLINSPFNDINVVGVSANSNGDGNVVAVLTAVQNLLNNAYDFEIHIYRRSLTNTDFLKETTITLSSDISFQLFSEFNFILDDVHGYSIVLSGIGNYVTNSSVVTFQYDGANWSAFIIPAPVVDSAFGHSMDMAREDANLASGNTWLIIGAPFAPGNGKAYIYRKTGLGPWTLITTLNSPNTTTPGQRIFGHAVNISRIRNVFVSTKKMQAYSAYRVPAQAPQLAIYTLDSAVWSAPAFITIPNNEMVDFFGYKVELIGENASLRWLIVGSPLSSVVRGLPTYGKVFIYNVVNEASYSLSQTLESPDTSYKNNEDSMKLVDTKGFGSWITRTINDAENFSIAISYPAFNSLYANRTGRVFSYTKEISNVSLFNLDAGTSAENQKYIRVYKTYVDANGNIINSELVTFPFNGTNVKFNLKTSRSTPYNDRYFVGDPPPALIIATNANPTFSIPTLSHNLIAGDKVLVKTYTADPNNPDTTLPHEFQLLTVDSVTANSVVLRTAELINNTYIANIINYNGVQTPVKMNGSNLYWNIFVSEDEFFGYQLLDSLNAQDIITHDITQIEIKIDEIKILEEVDIFLLDLYDDTVIKKEIPKIKFLGTYQGLLLGANIRYDDEQDKPEFRNRFIWSDASIGGSVETFTPFDYEVIGKNVSKELTGIIGTQDNIHVFKDRNSYAINGLLIGGQYRVRELISEETGCVNHNSLIAVRGQVLFMSDSGIYSVSGGGDPRELTDSNQPLFLSPEIDLKKSVSTFDGKNERVYIFIKNTDPAKNFILVWSYYFDSWFIYDGIPMTGPMVVYNNRLNVANGTELKEMKESVFMDYIDGATNRPVFFRYNTGWFHMGIPSIRKKFVNIVLFSILRLRDFAALPFNIPVGLSDPPDFSLDVTTQIDWIAKNIDKFNVPFMVDKRVDDHKISITQSKSIRYLLENNRDEPVLISGYEFEWESTQMKPKGLL
jgi:hypothetical protein